MNSMHACLSRARPTKYCSRTSKVGQFIQDSVRVSLCDRVKAEVCAKYHFHGCIIINGCYTCTILHNNIRNVAPAVALTTTVSVYLMCVCVHTFSGEYSHHSISLSLEQIYVYLIG